ncbi:MAG: ABC transporter ATP-binding protein [Armatimonadetes bacterium]|nr:ABC transporter ATP-binding protein [Armatimonadota bacterium]MDE2206573.1 ABC transporter ATP-binding protein [Armatimonadota bacterium]
MIRLDGVGRRFGKREVFRSVSLSALPGEVIAFTGANGSGKSTLLRIIAGLLPPTSGACRFTIHAADVPAIQRRRHLGYVAPDYSLYRDLTGTENIRLFADLRGRPLNRDEIRELLLRTGLRGRGRDMVATYSSGMRQRLKYACALAVDPAVLLLDEPGANLDTAGSEMVRTMIEAHRSRVGGGITLLATNEHSEVEWADRAIALTQAV